MTPLRAVLSWLVGLAGVAGLIGCGYWIGQQAAALRVERAERALEVFRSDLAAAVAAGHQQAAELQWQAAQERWALEARIAAALAAIPDRVAVDMTPRLSRLQEALRAPEYACLHRPMPADALSVLQRPAGVASAGGRGAGVLSAP